MCCYCVCLCWCSWDCCCDFRCCRYGVCGSRSLLFCGRPCSWLNIKVPLCLCLLAFAQLCEGVCLLFALKISNLSIFFTCQYAVIDTKMRSKKMSRECYCFIMFDHILTSYSVMYMIYISEHVQLKFQDIKDE